MTKRTTKPHAGEQPRPAAPPEPDPAWPRELVEFLTGPPDHLIEREQPAEPERKELDP